MRFRAAWTRFRLEEAQHLPAESELKLPLVAELSGFREAKYLSEAFKKLTGQTPGKFRHLATPSTQAVPPEAEESAGVTLAYHKG
ncbi:MAG: helix-turn-helix domain-containing protein [Polyangiaceae bacterium]|nr:helix-turn-helix domain-containing protein [Polyangiaceae bacterium]